MTQDTLEETQTEAPPTKAKEKKAPGNGSSPCPTIGVTHKTETAEIVTAHRRPSLRDDRKCPDRSNDNTNHATESQGVCAVVPVAQMVELVATTRRICGSSPRHQLEQKSS